MRRSVIFVRTGLRTANVDAKKTAEEKAQEQDAEILDAIKSRRKLASDMELAKGIQYSEPLKTRYVALMAPSQYNPS